MNLLWLGSLRAYICKAILVRHSLSLMIGLLNDHLLVGSNEIDASADNRAMNTWAGETASLGSINYSLTCFEGAKLFEAVAWVDLLKSRRFIDEAIITAITTLANWAFIWLASTVRSGPKEPIMAGWGPVADLRLHQWLMFRVCRLVHRLELALMFDIAPRGVLEIFLGVF